MSELNAVAVTCTTSLLHASNGNEHDTQSHRFSQTRGSFDDPELERLYQSYSIKQRFSDLKCFLYTSLFFSLYSILSSLIYITIINSETYLEHVVLILMTVLLAAIDSILIIWCHMSRNSWANPYSQIAPYLAWLIVLFELFISFYVRKTTPLYLFEDFGWIAVFSYFIYVTLPLSLFYCILLTTCTCVFYLFSIMLLYRFSSNSLQQLPVSTLLLLVVTFLGLTNYFMQEKQKRRAFLETRRSLEVKMIIEEESNEQERLLLSVLPKHVAVQMRQNLGAVDSQFKKIYMSRHENVSILYADIVGFTAISSTYSAQDLVKILNELFARFDRLAEKFYQLRIKILGDCYYCISGAPKERADHAVMCIHMGLSMVEAIKYVQQKTNSPVDMRVGIHTGAVLAGVLGQRQWQFDVYSKDVELANHMESSGMAGRVHISEKTLSYLNEEFEVEPGYGEKRDEILRIAGLKTYFIVKVLKPINQENSIQEPSIERNGDQKDFRKRLKKELLYKDNERDFEKHIDPILLRFTDRTIENAYYRQAGTLSRCSLPIFLFVRVVISCSHFFYLPRKLVNYVSFLILVILFLISFISVFCLLKLKTCYHNRKKTWIWTLMNIAGIFVLGICSINDIYICQVDNYSACKNPAFFSHTNILELILISQSEVLGFIGKTVAIVLFAVINCVIVGKVLSEKLDFDDSVIFVTNNQTNGDVINKRLPSKYLLNTMVILIAISLILLSRHWERVSRILFSWRSQVEVQREQAADMRHRNETLLYNVLPPHVATYFMEKGRILHDDELYSQSYSEVGVLFASMPNFSDFYSEETVNNQGLECLRFLNEVISDFDALLERDRFKKHITKIKTISSTYMAASGLNIDELNKPQYNSINERWLHLSTLVEFAIEMKKTLQNINEQSFNHFVLKMGINHGPVTAGVIGARKPHYDIWGNTVNVASRMESTGKAGCIQVTKECCEILENFGYRFEQRGLVHVKGKGQLMTYYLIEDINNNNNSIIIST